MPISKNVHFAHNDQLFNTHVDYDRELLVIMSDDGTFNYMVEDIIPLVSVAHDETKLQEKKAELGLPEDMDYQLPAVAAEALLRAKIALE